MARGSGTNLGSPNTIRSPVDLADLGGWVSRELRWLDLPAVRRVVCDLCESIDVLTRWPQEDRLLWPCCVRPAGSEKHRYPDALCVDLRKRGVKPNALSNGPAVTAFLFAGGERPERHGSTNAWSVHHLYSGKFPYVNRTETLHAVKDGQHFTRSAGLVALHPLLDAAADEFPVVSWLLRAHAYRRFGYDPDGVFSVPGSNGAVPGDGQVDAGL